MHPFAALQPIAAPLLDAAARGAVVLLLALVLTTLLRRRSAAARHAIWAGALASHVILLILAIAGPRWPVATPAMLDAFVAPIAAPAPALVDESSKLARPAVTTTSERVSADSPTEPKSPTSSSAPRTSTVVTTRDAPPSAPALSGQMLLLALWAVGALAILLRLAVGTIVVATLAKRGARVDDGGWLSMTQRLASSLRIGRPLTLLRGSRIGVPITWGIVYPIVLLPEDADAWTEERRRFVLVHEMAHVKRLDALTQLVGQVVLALFWFDPLVWIANRRMQLEREHACDDYVLLHGTQPTQYAEELLAMVRALGAPSHRSTQPAFAALAMARRSEFEGRMLSILDPVLDRHPLSGGRTLMGVLASLLVVVPLAALRPYHAVGPSIATPVAKAPDSSHVGALSSVRGEFPASFKIAITTPVPNNAAPPVASGSMVMQPPTTTVAASMVMQPQATSPIDPAGNAGTPQVAANTTKKLTVSPKSCDEPAVAGTTITSVHSDDDGDGRQNMTYMNLKEDGSCEQATIVGHVTFTDTEDDIASMPMTAHTLFRERTNRYDRELVVRLGSDGALSHILRVNGSAAPWDDDARRWFASFLPRVLSEGGINVKPRVARLRAQGGVSRVLSAIGAMHSPSARRAHYEALLDNGNLSNDELDQILLQVSRTPNSSSGDMRAILQRLAPGTRNRVGASAALERAVMSVSSSGDRTAVLQAYGESTDRSMLLSVMHMAETIPSSGDKSRLLSMLASRYLGSRDQELRDAFFRTLATVPSSGDLRTVLSITIPGYVNAQSPEMPLAFIKAATNITSSGDRATVLLLIADSGALRHPSVRDAYVRAAEGLASGDMSRVLLAAARH